MSIRHLASYLPSSGSPQNNYTISVSPAALSMGAGAVALRAARKIGVVPAPISASCGLVDLRVARRFSVSAATLALGGSAVNLRAARRLVLAPVAATLVVGDIEFVYIPAESGTSYSIPITSAAMTLTGGNVAMRVTRKVAASAAGLALQTGDARMLAARRLGVGAGALEATAGQAMIRAICRLLTSPAQLVVSGGAVMLSYRSQIEYARAPTGGGYAPAASPAQVRPVESKQARSSQIGGSRPPATQRNRR